MEKIAMFLNKYVVMLENNANCDILGDSLAELLQDVFSTIRICVPILVVVLIAIDILGAVTSGDEKAMKESQSRAVKRIIIGIVIFFIPTLINLILKYAGYDFGTCGIE